MDSRVKSIPTQFDILFEDEPTRIRVEWRGKDNWAITDGRQCLSRSGKWDFEPLPSSRTDKWLEEHRWTKDEALERALSHVDYLVQRNEGGDIYG